MPRERVRYAGRPLLPEPPGEITVQAAELWAIYAKFHQAFTPTSIGPTDIVAALAAQDEAFLAIERLISRHLPADTPTE